MEKKEEQLKATVTSLQTEQGKLEDKVSSYPLAMRSSYAYSLVLAHALYMQPCFDPCAMHCREQTAPCPLRCAGLLHSDAATHTHARGQLMRAAAGQVREKEVQIGALEKQ
eukprot:2025247-Rhodomonas_salina.1